MTLSGRSQRDAYNAISSSGGEQFATLVTARASRLAQRRAFEDLVAHVVVLHELKKTGALTYEEFTILKSRLLDL